MASSPRARSPVITAASSPIAFQTRICFKLFDSVAGFPSIRPEAVDSFGRFKLWAGNLGALHGVELQSSLDFRLRNTPKIATQVIDLLEELTESLEEAYLITSNKRENRISSLIDDVDAPSPNSDEEVSEIKEIFASITDAINNLFRLSMIIRNSTSRDRYLKAAAAAAVSSPFNDQFDISHVSHKFPALHLKGRDWLAVRLGKAITQRRRYLWYCREHHGKTLRNLQLITSKDGAESRLHSAAVTGADGKSALFKPSLSGIGDTQASTFLLPSEQTFQMEPAEESQSQTSYATSVDEDKSATRLTVIPLENVTKGMPHFECPYCWQIQGIKTQKAWKKHVLSDLKPYVCCFEACELKMFADPHAWFLHELKDHRKEWKCYYCSHGSFNSPGDYKVHLKQRHSSSFSEDQIPILLEMSQRQAVAASPTDCPFCDDWESRLRDINVHIPASETLVVTLSQFRHHVGGHMEQLALFAIPPGYTERDDVDSNIAEAHVESEKSSLMDNVRQWAIEETERSTKLSTIEADMPALPTVEDVLNNSAPEPWTLSAFMPCFPSNNNLDHSRFIEDAKEYVKSYHSLADVEPLSRNPSLDRFNRRSLGILWKRLLDTYIVDNAPMEISLPVAIQHHLVSLPNVSIPPNPAYLDLIIKIIYEVMVMRGLLDSSEPISSVNHIVPSHPNSIDSYPGSGELRDATDDVFITLLESESNAVSEADSTPVPMTEDVSLEELPLKESVHTYFLYTIKFPASSYTGRDLDWDAAAVVKEQIAEGEVLEQIKRLASLQQMMMREKKEIWTNALQNRIYEFLRSREPLTLEGNVFWSQVRVDSEERYIMPEMRKTLMISAYIIRSPEGSQDSLDKEVYGHSATWSICAYCEKFQVGSQKDQLQRHIRNYHHVEDNSSFQDEQQIFEPLYYCHHDRCDLVGKNGWMSEVDLTKHVKKVHGFANFGLGGFRSDSPNQQKHEPEPSEPKLYTAI